MTSRILKLDITGRPLHWIGLQEAASLWVKELVSWTVGDPTLKIQGGINRLSGRPSKLEFPPVIAVKGKSKRDFSLAPPLNNRWLFARDGYLCLYCGEPFSYQNLTRDHVFPKGLGGKNTWENCVAACRSCNNHKGCRTPEQAGMKLLAVPYKPNRYEFLALSNRHILADQMDFLRKGFSQSKRF